MSYYDGYNSWNLGNQLPVPQLEHPQVIDYGFNNFGYFKNEVFRMIPMTYKTTF